MKNNFNKALLYLDRGKIKEAQKLLKEIILQSEQEHNSLYLIKANVVLGHLYFTMELYDQAQLHLLKALDITHEDDVVDEEKHIARKLLKQLHERS